MFFYVIMPVGADPNFLEKKSILLRVAQEEGLTPYFPFERTENVKFDMRSTLSILKDSDFVLADLSMERPSCYYELGLAEALGKDVYLIARRGTDIHQAQSRNLAHFYDGLKNYEDVISNVLKEARDVMPLLRLRA